MPLKVLCAIIYFKDKILTVQRSVSKRLLLKWEFQRQPKKDTGLCQG
jgi:hypothetical protein